MLIIRHGDQLLLGEASAARDLGRLYCFPQVESLTEVTGRLRELGLEDATYQELAGFRHTSATSTSISALC